MPIYDTCDEIVSTIVLTENFRELTRNVSQRRKIGLHLRKDGVTQAQFMRDLSAQFHTQTVKIQSNSLNTFRGQRELRQGPDRMFSTLLTASSKRYVSRRRKPKARIDWTWRTSMESMVFRVISRRIRNIFALLGLTCTKIGMDRYALDGANWFSVTMLSNCKYFYGSGHFRSNV